MIGLYIKAGLWNDNNTANKDTKAATTITEYPHLCVLTVIRLCVYIRVLKKGGLVWKTSSYFGGHFKIQP